MNILEVKNLKAYYFLPKGAVKAVDDVTLTLRKGDTLGLAGESACGKTSVLLAIMRLLPNNARIVGGNISFDGINLLRISNEELREMRWTKLSVVFQGAMNTLNPLLTIGEQIAEVMTVHEGVEKSEAWERARRLLRDVSIDPSRAGNYPHEFSGGMRQRAMIAMALACNPRLVMADEPSTALDVIVQNQIMELLRELKRKMDLSMILISHDLSILAQTCNRVAVMYAGKIVEHADVLSIFRNPMHPYTRGLIGAFPSIVGPITQLQSIGGRPPSLLSPPQGCRFHPRCPCKMDICTELEPKLKEVASNRWVACHLR